MDGHLPVINRSSDLQTINDPAQYQYHNFENQQHQPEPLGSLQNTGRSDYNPRSHLQATESLSKTGNCIKLDVLKEDEENSAYVERDIRNIEGKSFPKNQEFYQREMYVESLATGKFQKYALNARIEDPD